MAHKRHNRKEPRETLHVTCRVNASTASIIKSDADKLGIRPGTMLARILERYASWGRFEAQLGFAPIPKWLLTGLVNEVSEERLRELSAGVLPYFKDIIILKTGKYDLKSCIDVFEEHGLAAGMIAEHTVEGPVHCFTLRHELGKTWSVIIQSVWQQMFDEFVPESGATFDLHDNIISIRIVLGADW